MKMAEAGRDWAGRGLGHPGSRAPNWTAPAGCSWELPTLIVARLSQAGSLRTLQKMIGAFPSLISTSVNFLAVVEEEDYISNLPQGPFGH